MSYFLYILQSASFDKYYVGISSNPIRRLMFHNSIEKGFTSRYRPWKIVFTQEFLSKLSANQSELKIKNWKNKTMIQRVIKGEILI